MKQKALDSLKAAQRLVDAHKTYGYNSSIHCSYYALLQYMKYKLTTSSNPLGYDKQVKKGCSSHIFILQEIKERIKDSSKKQMFAKVFLKLKKQRVLADYEQQNFTEKESSSCKEQAKKAMDMLNQYLR